MAYGDLLFRTGAPVTDVYIYYVSDMIDIWNTDSTYIYLPMMFLSSTDIRFEQQTG